jgi:hypothetical protein
MAKDARRFDLVAETQIILDGEVAHCWELVRAGIRRGLLDTDHLRALIDRLRAGDAVALEELVLERDDAGDRLRIALDGDRRTCPAAAMLDELERLARRAGAASAGSSAAPPPSPSPPTPPPTAGAAEVDLLGWIARLLGTTPERLAGDPVAYRAQVERVRAAVARWREVAADPGSDAAARDATLAELRAVLATTGEQAAATAAGRAGDLEATVRTLGIDPDQLSRAARAVADWLEQRTPAAGAAVDRMIAALEAAAAPLLDRATGVESDADRERRLREEVRASIAARIKLPPSS